jgi:hypothetical protein
MYSLRILGRPNGSSTRDMSGNLQPPDPISNKHQPDLQGSLPATGARQMGHDPFGLSSLLSSAREILQLSRIPKEQAEILLKTVRPQLLSTGLLERGLDPRALASLLAESPVVVSLLERLNDSSVLLGAHRKKEEFSLVGCLYAYAEIAARSPLTAAELIRWHAGERSVDLEDVYDKLQAIYAEMASEQHSPVKRLLEGEFNDTNQMEASAITAGIIAPLVAISQHITTTPTDSSPREGILQRLWSIGSAAVQNRFETPKELRDLQIIGERLSEQLVKTLRALSTMHPRPPVPEVSPEKQSATEAPSKVEKVPEETKPKSKPEPAPQNFQMPPIPHSVIIEAPPSPEPTPVKPIPKSMVIQMPGVRKISPNSDAPAPVQLTAEVKKVEASAGSSKAGTASQPGKIAGVSKKSDQK